MKISDQEFTQLRELLCRISGIDIPENKKYLFETRLSRFLVKKKIKCFSELYRKINTGRKKELERQFIQSMTTHESSFFRDSHPFQWLETRLLPQLAHRRRAEAVFMPARIRILSAGCSYGQEPYSIAMCVEKWRRAQPSSKMLPEVDITAIDISSKVLKKAKLGRYSNLEMGNSIPEALKREFFKYQNGMWEISDRIKQAVSFSEMNLSEPLDRLGKFDIIFCRNVIIYLQWELKRKILLAFHKALNKGGAIFLGAFENMYNLKVDFESRIEENTMFYIPKQ